MTATFTIETFGFRALDKALAELPKSIAKAVCRRTLALAGEPIAEEARNLVPIDTGHLKASIAVSTTIKNKVGNAEFAAAMRAGLGKDAAVSALRDARRSAGTSSITEMFIGPSRGKGVISYAHLVEFGSSKMAPEPYMRPAWDSQKMHALEIIKRELGTQIIQAAKRIGKSKTRDPDVKYHASMAAMIAVEGGY